MALSLSPIGNEQQVSTAGAPLSGGLLYTYLAGSTTPAPTYTDSTGATPQANPIVLNTLGRASNPVWLTDGTAYKFVLTTAAGVSQWTIDNVTGVSSSTPTQDEWISQSSTPTYIGATQFSVAGDQTATFTVGRRIKAVCTGGVRYGYISVSAYTTLTTITVVLDSGSLDSGISVVSVGLLASANSSMPWIKSSATGLTVQGPLTASSTVTLAANAATALEAVTKQQMEATFDQVFPITATVATNNLTVTLGPTVIQFRSSTTNSGAVTSIQTSANTTIIVGSGVTLGTINGQAARLVVIAFNDAGTVRLAVANQAGGVNFDEGGLISPSNSVSSTTTAIYASGGTYSNVPYRVVGYIDVTEATAGTWATAPTVVQGSGGNAITSLSSIGYGQAYSNVTGSRSFGTTYYNLTGRPIFVTIAANNASSATFTLAVNGVNAHSSAVSAGGAVQTYSAIVPPGASYVAAMSAGTATNVYWSELR